MQCTILLYNIIYPQVYFDPGNYTNPLQINYKVYYELLSANLFKKKRYFFSQVELQQDRGLIFESNYKSNLITLDYTENEIDYKSYDDLKDPYQSTGVYGITIYLGKDHNKYNLSYMKIQDIAAQVGGLLKILMVFFSIINYHANLFKRDLDVLNNIFEFEVELKRSKSDNKNIQIKNFLSQKKTCKI